MNDWPDTIVGCIDSTAVIGSPPEHRDVRRKMALCEYPDGAGAWPAPYCKFCTNDARCPRWFYPEIAGSAIIEALVTVDSGLSRPTHIGERVLLMKGVHVGHDSVVHDDVEMAPLSNLGGHVIVGKNTRIGLSAVVKPFVRIGQGARIGLGSVVITDIPAHTCWAGNPARFLYNLCPRCGSKADSGSTYCVEHDAEPWAADA